MTVYGVFQEMATFFIYCRQEARAEAEGDEALRTIYRLNARDEIAHTRFYQDVVKLLLEEDRPGVLADIATVTKNFEMPGVGLVPDYDSRVAVMREAGIDRATFLQKVYFPVLKYLDVTRQEMVEASKRARRAAEMAVPPAAT
jgi:acyl-[acyl-carrier protein] desaturase